MGPHFFKCGKVGWRGLLVGWLAASMGPHFFKCGKWQGLRMAGYSGTGASMGPHFFKCGNQNLSHKFVPNKKLQWGRTFSSAENRRQTRHHRASISFNGAALFQVRKNQRNTHGRFGVARLQWGRTFSSAEKRQEVRHVPCFRGPASMGPHFFKCGKST